MSKEIVISEDEKWVRERWPDARLLQWMVLWPNNIKCWGYQVEGTAWQNVAPAKSKDAAWSNARQRIESAKSVYDPSATSLEVTAAFADARQRIEAASVKDDNVFVEISHTSDGFTEMLLSTPKPADTQRVSLPELDGVIFFIHAPDGSMVISSDPFRRDFVAYQDFCVAKELLLASLTQEAELRIELRASMNWKDRAETAEASLAAQAERLKQAEEFLCANSHRFNLADWKRIGAFLNPAK